MLPYEFKSFIIDHLNPEDCAMLQALYSRSDDSVEQHTERIKKSGSSNFMKRFYVGYNHKSIGDCGSTTIFLEGISILAAKAFQDTPLYRGQECSTRYLDFSKRNFHDPFDTDNSLRVLESWREFYVFALKEQYEFLLLGEQDADDNRKRAIKAKAFDICRSLLPCGATTNIAWHVDLRHAFDRLFLLQYHPLSEIADIASWVHEKLKKRYPSSFNHKISPEANEYMTKTGHMFHYNYESMNRIQMPEDLIIHDQINWKSVKVMLSRAPLLNRPQKGLPMPRIFEVFGTITFQFPLDYGSFRDLQRHRNMILIQPVINHKSSIHTWYLSNYCPAIRKTLEIFLDMQQVRIDEFDDNKLITRIQMQYLLPMGMLIPVQMTCSLNQLLYIIELRTGKTVHPTLRKVALDMYKYLSIQLPDLKIYADESKDDIHDARGKQTIFGADNKPIN